MKKFILLLFVLIYLNFVNAECNISKILEKDSFYYPRNPNIYSNIIVYENENNIRGYNIGFDLKFNTSDDLGFFNVTDNNLLNIEPNIYNKTISWITFNQSSEVYRCNLENNGNYNGCLWNDTNIKVTDYLSLKRRPFLIKNILLWEDNLYGNFDIFMCNLNLNCIYNLKKKRVTNNSFDQISVHSDGNIIIWEDYRNGNADIYMHNLNINKEYPVIVDIGDQRKPSISYYSFILWDSNKNLSDDIYFKSVGYDLIPYTYDDSWEYLIAGSLFDEINAEISKEDKPGLIVWETIKFNNIGLEGFNFFNNSFFEININGIDLNNPSVFGNNIVFEGLGNQKKYLFISECK